MSLDDSQISNKMIGTPPAKKGWHFPATLTHAAEFVEAETAEEAERLYHSKKRLISAPDAAPEQSTGATETTEDING